MVHPIAAGTDGVSDAVLLRLLARPVNVLT